MIFPESKTNSSGYLLDKFSNILAPIQRKKELIIIENQELAKLRDWLLPMLMNGQVRVK